MKVFEYDSLDTAYYHVVKDVYENGKEVSPRGMLTKELSPVSITITNPKNRVISNEERKLNYGFMIGEAIWYLSGTNDLEQVAHYNSQWRKHSDDGKTLNGAYGNRIFKYEDVVKDENGQYQEVIINQFEAMIEKLKNDKDSRHGTVLIFRPTDLIKQTKDVPCNNLLRFSIRENKLNLINIVRSNDIIFGLPYDIHFFTLLQEMAASRLNVELGTYTHVVDSLHIYEMHFEMAQRIIEKGQVNIYDRVETQDYGISSKEEYEFNLQTIFEIEVITRNNEFDSQNIDSLIDKLSNEGWKNYARILASYNAKKYKRPIETNKYLDQITNEFNQLCNWKMEV